MDGNGVARCLARFEDKPNMWLGSLRAGDGRPHLVPIWYVIHDGKLWVATLPSQKSRNIAVDARVIAALDDTDSPCVLEGTARLETAAALRNTVAPFFVTKYQWDFRSDEDGDYLLFSITPTRALIG
jgi:hypothetical protein